MLRLPHLHLNDLLAPQQSGFRSNHSTTSSLHLIIDSCIKARDNKYHSSIISFDVQKAFDSVKHKILLQKLTAYNFSPTATAWLENYLTQRLQFVSLNHTLSDHSPISTGVPQGSILGPLLFLLYINDLPSAINSSSTLSIYADDTVLLSHSNNLTNLNLNVNKDINGIVIWFNSNQLCLHPTKSKALLISNK